MVICYRDNIGIVVTELESNWIDCDGQYAYFTDRSGKDYKIPLSNIVSIKAE